MPAQANDRPEERQWAAASERAERAGGRHAAPAPPDGGCRGRLRRLHVLQPRHRRPAGAAAAGGGREGCAGPVPALPRPLADSDDVGAAVRPLGTRAPPSGRCRRTVSADGPTDPLTTRGTAPLPRWRGGWNCATRLRPWRTGERDAGAGRGGGDAAAARAGLGHATDRGRAGVRPQDGAALPRRGRLGTVPPAGAAGGAGRARGVAGERFRRHRGNADVVRQELAAELGIAVSLRTVERAVAHLRRELAAEALATVRFETPPGRQLQIDFGERRGADRRGDGAGPPVRRHAGLLAAGVRPRLPARAAVGVAGRDGGRLPPLRRRAGRAAAGQRQGARRAPRPGDARGDVQRAPARLRPLLGRAAGGLRALPRPRQGQGRARRRLRQGQRHRRPELPELGGAGGAPGPVGARGGRHARARHHGRGAARALRARRGGGAAAAGRPAAVPAGARADAAGAERRLRRRGHQPLQRAVGADRRPGQRRRQRRGGAGPARGRGGGAPRAAAGSARARRRSGPPARDRRGRRRRAVAGGRPSTVTSAGADLLRPLAEYERAAGGAW